jgi:hypothetical protein
MLAEAAPFLLGALLTGLLAGDHGGYWPTSWGWATVALVWAGALALVLRDVQVSRLDRRARCADRVDCALLVLDGEPDADRPRG